VPAGLKAQVEQLRAQLPSVATMHAMREDLRQLWSNATLTREQMAEGLQAWCRRAEDSGIAALQEFSLRLRAIKMA
jgi:stearoyl-CoA desaturase (delta-9 desaturase)